MLPPECVCIKRYVLIISQDINLCYILLYSYDVNLLAGSPCHTFFAYTVGSMSPTVYAVIVTDSVLCSSSALPLFDLLQNLLRNFINQSTLRLQHIPLMNHFHASSENPSSFSAASLQVQNSHPTIDRYSSACFSLAP